MIYLDEYDNNRYKVLSHKYDDSTKKLTVTIDGVPGFVADQVFQDVPIDTYALSIMTGVFDGRTLANFDGRPSVNE